MDQNNSMIENYESSILLKMFGDIFQIPLTRVETFIKGPPFWISPPHKCFKRALSLYKYILMHKPPTIEQNSETNNNLSS